MIGYLPSLLSEANPSYPFTISPFSILLFPSAGDICSLAVLFAIEPFSPVASAIGPLEFSVAFLFIFAIVAYIFSTVGPNKSAVAVHFVGAPHSCELTGVRPNINPLPMDAVVLKLSCVRRIISPVKSANAMLEPIFVIAIIPCVVWPAFNAVAMLPIFLPVTSILGPVHVLVGAYSLSFVIQPLPLIAVTVIMDKPTFAEKPVGFPGAGVLATIFPHLDADTFSLAILVPLAMVDSPVTQLYWSLFNQGQVGHMAFGPVKLKSTEAELCGFGAVIGVVWHFFQLFLVGNTPIVVDSTTW